VSRRAWVFTLLTTAEDRVYAERVYPRGSLGLGNIPAEPQTPYLMYAFGEDLTNEEVRDGHDSITTTLRIYVYDKKGSYVRIDEIHKFVRETLKDKSGYEAAGWRCTDIVARGIGEETTDGTNNLRIGSYTLTGPE
jgi:hypothetical protein